VLAAIEKGLWPFAGLIVLGSLLALVYVWRVVETAYLQAPAKGAPAVGEAPLSMLLPLWLMALGSIYFGVDATRTASIALDAAAILLGGEFP